MTCTRIFILLLTIFNIVSCGFGPHRQDYAFETVRPGCRMFWWLYHTKANVTETHERPIIVWFQGGPGGASSGRGNFEVMGPLDVDLNLRENTLLNDFNLMYIDTPMHTGYSNADNEELYPTNMKQTIDDLYQLIKGFIKKLPQFTNTPIYLYGESFGGKTALELGYRLWNKNQYGSIKIKPAGIVLGGTCINIMYCISLWPTLLYYWSFTDLEGSKVIESWSKKIEELYNASNWTEAVHVFVDGKRITNEQVGAIDMFNVINRVTAEAEFPKPKTKRRLNQLMNGPVKVALNIPENVTWVNDVKDVFYTFKKEIMEPAHEIVEKVLNETTMKLYLVSGSNDLICNTPGQLKWVNELRWPGKKEYIRSKRSNVLVDDFVEGYQKGDGRFKVFWALRSGHRVAMQNPALAREILKSLTGF